METTLLQTALAAFTEDVTAHLATGNHLDSSALRRGLERTVPLALHVLLARVEGPYGPEMAWQLGRDAHDAHVLQHLDRLDQSGWQKRGEDLMRDLLGDTYPGVVQEHAAATQLPAAAVGRLLGSSAVAVLGVVGHHAWQHALDPTGLALWLRTEKVPLRQVLLRTSPAGSSPDLAAASQQGAGMIPLPELPRTAPWAAAPSPEAGTARWQWGLLLLLAVLLGYLFGHDRLKPEPRLPQAGLELGAGVPVRPAVNAPSAAQAGRYDDASGNYIYDTGQPLILRLADGTTQKVGANSTENRLFTFLADPAIEVDSVNRTKGWINFDRVYFEPGSTLLTDESYQQLRNVASILKTFPESVVKIGGYTDSTGTALKNFQLSEERAKTAMLAIANAGVDINRIQAKGYGGKYFITPNTTPEGRALNRRISIRVIKK